MQSIAPNRNHARFNYRHLHVFWAVATRGSLSGACDMLGVTPQTLSEQLRQFESSIGTALFVRDGRGLVLTEKGRVVLGYADEMFAIGQRLQEALAEAAPERPVHLRVGVADAVPKSIAYRLLEPAMRYPQPVRMLCREAGMEDLMADMAAHRLDLVLADSAMPASMAVHAFSHLLGECGISLFASAELAERFPGPLPVCLHNAPLLLPGPRADVRARLLRWCDERGLRPRIVGEFDDGALMKSFGQAGAGFFPAPTAIAADVVKQYGVVPVGEIPDVREQFYGISIQRRITHPVVTVIVESARAGLLSPVGSGAHAVPAQEDPKAPGCVDGEESGDGAGEREHEQPQSQ